MTFGDIVLSRLKEDLVGPYEENEILFWRPSDVYLTGMLWPGRISVGAEEDDQIGLSGESDSAASSGNEEGVSLLHLNRPCSAGVSFATKSTTGDAKIDVKVRFATYIQSDVSRVEHAEGNNGYVQAKKKWTRRAYSISVKDVLLKKSSGYIHLEEHGSPPGVNLHIRAVSCLDDIKRTFGTVTLVNASLGLNDSRKRDDIEKLMLFQVCTEIWPSGGGGTELIARPVRHVVSDKSGPIADILYRNAHEFATGHTCSAMWEATNSEQGIASMVGTSWIPNTAVPRTSGHGHEVFHALRDSTKHKPLSAQWLATAKPTALGEALQKLPMAYKKWIGAKKTEMASLPEFFQNQAAENIETCERVHSRMTSGAEWIANDDTMLRAFSLANLAMEKQYGWDHLKKGVREPLEWRPFQLGFILLAAASVVDREHPDREIMDLLWFPTGGGKTEAYLALIAFLAFYRRLSAGDDPDEGGGVAAIMRYTLRLLTTQQFSRAASVILACEAIRRGRICEAGVSSSRDELGSTPFSIGLWVGSDAVPNKVCDAAAALRQPSAPDRPTPKQLVNCPACHEELTCNPYENPPSAIHVRCHNKECLLFCHENPLPVWTVDEDVYRERPTLLIGTIDKFAQIVKRKEISNLFNLSNRKPPDLILQDELHLIAGPLGTVAGLYEVAIDRMFSCGGAVPKIIGSTATIKRAPEQVKSLFNRTTEQFPPSGIDAKDSAFAVVDRKDPGRSYTGVTTAGRSAKFTYQAVAASLLQSASGATTDDKIRDSYWTLVSYFNSLRELGGALVLMHDDVNRSIEMLAKRRGEECARRKPKWIAELTSRRTQAEVREMLDKLSIPVDDKQNALDVVLATNMLSVGVDIPRLGLMLVFGQPKGIAEYIQATSRVGRGEDPGLVVTVFNNAKARDRSHYETFPAWHETLYRDVEPASVTPFAPRALDKALHAVLVALVRHLVPGMLDRPVLNNKAIKDTENIINYIVERSKEIDSQEGESVREKLNDLLDNWKTRNPQSYWKMAKTDSLLQDAERAATLSAMGRSIGEAWPTLNSMRDVEASTRFKLNK